MKSLFFGGKSFIFVQTVPFHPNVSRMTLTQFFLIDNRLVHYIIIAQQLRNSRGFNPYRPPVNSGGFFTIAYL